MTHALLRSGRYDPVLTVPEDIFDIHYISGRDRPELVLMEIPDNLSYAKSKQI